jgi:hypothetical protein
MVGDLLQVAVAQGDERGEGDSALDGKVLWLGRAVAAREQRQVGKEGWDDEGIAGSAGG